MGDYKRSCPACRSWTNAIGQAFAHGDPCPNCGLPAAAVLAFDQAVRRNQDSELSDRMVKAEQRAAACEAEVRRLTMIMDEIRGNLDNEVETRPRTQPWRV